MENKARGILVLGLGNLILSDEGIGSVVARVLSEGAALDAEIMDGGTTGLRLLPEIENRAGVIFVDAANLKAEPGTLKVFEDHEFDGFLNRITPSAHDVGLHDLVTTLRLTGTIPARRALVAVQPGSLEMGDSLSSAVSESVEKTCDAVRALVSAWTT
ncbi:hydrogenase maturation protease [Magnetospira sp. QH-2]|uniref:hydrogenase maturation protease n=1 Tax=Magnetospira sp. (strain QH-2) TaxID=1288970 RepID=UPI0003E81851|nr:hydrogenase maturation protease [Magnetospira sp. QH-2]CCQ72242.1 maturation element for NiFe hydrogenase 2 [Magnetospira sp. QH-2]